MVEESPKGAMMSHELIIHTSGYTISFNLREYVSIMIQWGSIHHLKSSHDTLPETKIVSENS